MKEACAPNRKIIMLFCNVDDMTGEDMAFAREKAVESGAVEFYTAAVQMKKGRPGLEIRAFCTEEKADCVAAALLKHTTTFGVKKQALDAYALSRKTATMQTQYGEVRFVIAEGYGTIKHKPEYEDVAIYAEKAGISIMEARRQLNVLFANQVKND